MVKRPYKKMVAGVESDLYASHFLLAFDIVVDSVLIVCYHKSIFYVDDRSCFLNGE